MREKLRQNIHGVRGCEGCLEGGGWLRGGVGTGRGPRGMGGMIEQQCATAAAPRPRTRQLERQLDRTAEWLGRGPEAGRALGAPRASFSLDPTLFEFGKPPPQPSDPIGFPTRPGPLITPLDSPLPKRSPRAVAADFVRRIPPFARPRRPNQPPLPVAFRLVFTR